MIRYECTNKHGQRLRAYIDQTRLDTSGDYIVTVDLLDWEAGKWLHEWSKRYTTLKGAEKGLLKRYPNMKREQVEQ